MKYIFLTILHYMKLDTTLNRGIKLAQGTRISNGKEYISNILNTRLMKTTAGIHSVDEFSDQVYYYKTGEFSHIKDMDAMQKEGMDFTFYFLREAQFFLTDLWLVKDNSVYVRDGFLITYEDKIENGITFKGSLSAIFSNASGNIIDTVFTKDEINEAIKTFTSLQIEDVGKMEQGGKSPTFEHFFKRSNVTRMNKAAFYTLAARSNLALPMKIVSYCTAIECLFNTGKIEVAHKISERVALMLGTSTETKIDIFKFVKKAYDFRSTIIHGSFLKGNEKGLLETTIKLDQFLRELIVGDHEIFSKSDKEIDEFFFELLF